MHNTNPLTDPSGCVIYKSEEFKIGDEIICIDNKGIEKLLDLHKRYKCYDIVTKHGQFRWNGYNSDRYLVVGISGRMDGIMDPVRGMDGLTGEFFSGRFTSLKSFREDKLNYCLDGT